MCKRAEEDAEKQHNLKLGTSEELMSQIEFTMIVDTFLSIVWRRTKTSLNGVNETSDKHNPHLESKKKQYKLNLERSLTQADIFVDKYKLFFIYMIS